MSASLVGSEMCIRDSSLRSVAAVDVVVVQATHAADVSEVRYLLCHASGHQPGWLVLTCRLEGIPRQASAAVQ
eukprot:5356587-Alexandrium_andersonii.AAC.1